MLVPDTSWNIMYRYRLCGIFEDTFSVFLDCSKIDFQDFQKHIFLDIFFIF